MNWFVKIMNAKAWRKKTETLTVYNEFITIGKANPCIIINYNVYECVYITQYVIMINML